MPITITKFAPATDPRNIEHYRRENAFNHELALIDLAKGNVIATARFYGKGMTSYCVLWVWLREHHHFEGAATSARGYGKAGGYGYHKDSAALSEAMNRAGVTLSEPIDARGDVVMLEAMEAIAKHLKVRRFMVHKAHA